MTFKYLAGLFALFFCCLKITAQHDSTYYLKEVVVADWQLTNSSSTQNTLTIARETIEKQVGTFTQLLNGKSGLYFKENGAGMVSSVSFRGTSAQQTAVIWNGINTNSQLNGQTDFNTLSSADFSNITLKSGGGSVLYGSGAIGGSIHLENKVKFNEKSNYFAKLYTGSFNSHGGYFRWQHGTKRWAYNLGISRNQSENDYPYLGTNLKNENGNYYNQSFNSTIQHIVNKHHTITFYNQLYDSQRDFSGSLGVRSDNRFTDWNTRNLLEWTRKKTFLEQRLKVAFLTEKYQFYENKTASHFDFGQAQTLLIRQENSYHFSEKTTWIAQIEYQNTTGKGSNFEKERRTVANVSAVLKEKISRKLYAEVSVRLEKNKHYKTPLLYAISSSWKKNKYLALKGHFSKNYRIPTFNDLYWQGSGNSNLKPETALQYEIGPYFKTKNIQFTTQYFAIHLTDLLRWIPHSSGVWTPENTSKVNIKGFETSGFYEKKNQNYRCTFEANYTYTKSVNQKTNKELIYVPNHKATFLIDYQYKKINSWLQMIYQDGVFTSSDNFNSLPAYSLLNFGWSYQFQKSKVNYRVGIQSQNLRNENYQNVLARPMPGRNYQFLLTLNL